MPWVDANKLMSKLGVLRRVTSEIAECIDIHGCRFDILPSGANTIRLARLIMTPRAQYSNSEADERFQYRD